jgi:hypothetical protein
MSYEDGLFKEVVKEDLIEENLLQIKSSPINGKGIFTLKEIKYNRLFYSIPMNDLRKTPSPSFARLSNNFFVNDPIVLNYVNHSCNPNSEIVLNQKGAFLQSKRVILKDEEITVDYCATEEKNTLIECKCGATNCRNFFYITG